MLNLHVHFTAGNTFVTELGCTCRYLSSLTELQNKLCLVLQEVHLTVEKLLRNLTI